MQPKALSHRKLRVELMYLLSPGTKGTTVSLTLSRPHFLRDGSSKSSGFVALSLMTSKLLFTEKPNCLFSQLFLDAYKPGVDFHLHSTNIFKAPALRFV